MQPMKRVLLAEEEYSTRVFDASTPELLYKAALKLLKERSGPNSYYMLIAEEPTIPTNPDITPEQIAQLPDALKLQANELLDKYRYSLRAYKKNKQEYDEIIEALEKEDGKLAWDILVGRSRHEYEKVSLEEIENVE